MANYFEDVCKTTKYYKKASNVVLTDICAILNAENITIEEFSIPADHIADLVNQMGDGKISSWIGKDVFAKMMATGKTASTIVAEENLAQMDNDDEMENICRSIIEANPKSVEDYHKGKDNALKFLMGQVMKQTKGKANPVKATELLKGMLG